MPADSVAKRILAALVERLKAIDGTGNYFNDLADRVYRRRPSYDTETEPLPALFVYRKAGGETRDGTPPTITHAVVYEVVAVVEATSTAGDALEEVLADIERALERPGDLFLDSSGSNLLSQELALTPSDFVLPADAVAFEALAIGVQCTFPHTYGDPSDVTP